MTRCPGGGTGRRKRLKISRCNAPYRFDSGPGHHIFIGSQVRSEPYAGACHARVAHYRRCLFDQSMVIFLPIDSSWIFYTENIGFNILYLQCPCDMPSLTLHLTFCVLNPMSKQQQANNKNYSWCIFKVRNFFWNRALKARKRFGYKQSIIGLFLDFVLLFNLNVIRWFFPSVYHLIICWLKFMLPFRFQFQESKFETNFFCLNLVDLFNDFVTWSLNCCLHFYRLPNPMHFWYSCYGHLFII